MRQRALAGLAAGFTLTLLSAQAGAFCRTYSCDPTRESCPQDAENPACLAGGVPLFWRGPCVGYALQQDASRQVDFETFRITTDKAFSAWQNVVCAGHPVGIAANDLGPVACNKQEYNQAGGNANVVTFRDTSWPYAHALDTLALTTLTFNVQTGEIYDADIEIKATPDVTITTSDTNVNVDLLSVLTHEAGHFFGLAHSPDTKAAMYATYSAGMKNLRDLAADDRAAICAVYPGGQTADSCDPTPRHCFASQCGGTSCDDVGTACSLATSPGAHSPCPAPAIGALAVVGVALTVRRRRARA